MNIFKKKSVETEEERMAKIPPIKDAISFEFNFNPKNVKLGKVGMPWQEVKKIYKEEREELAKLTRRKENENYEQTK